MIKAINDVGSLIHVIFAKRKHDYTCPSCGNTVRMYSKYGVMFYQHLNKHQNKKFDEKAYRQCDIHNLKNRGCIISIDEVSHCNSRDICDDMIMCQHKV